MNLANCLGFYDDEPKVKPSAVPTDLRFRMVAAGAANSLGINLENRLCVWGMGQFVCNEVKNVKRPTVLARLNHEEFK